MSWTHHHHNKNIQKTVVLSGKWMPLTTLLFMMVIYAVHICLQVILRRIPSNSKNPWKDSSVQSLLAWHDSDMSCPHKIQLRVSQESKQFVLLYRSCWYVFFACSCLSITVIHLLCGIPTTSNTARGHQNGLEAFQRPDPQLVAQVVLQFAAKTERWLHPSWVTWGHVIQVATNDYIQYITVPNLKQTACNQKQATRLATSNNM